MTKVGHKLWYRFMHSDTLVFTFLRSIVSSQAASWIDVISGFLLFAFLGFSPFLSAALGAIAGGVVNCIINYRFTFHAEGCSRKAVGIKYTLVWIGSVLLNSFGTDGVYDFLQEWRISETLGLTPQGCYAVARLVVSLVVSLLWNFALQRVFVYRKTAFDIVCIRFVDFFIPRRISALDLNTKNGNHKSQRNSLKPDSTK